MSRWRGEFNGSCNLRDMIGVLYKEAAISAKVSMLTWWLEVHSGSAGGLARELRKAS